jgi:protein TonB
MNSGSRRAVRVSVLVLALCAIGACKKEQAAEQPDAGQAPAAQQPQAPPQQAVSSQVAAMGTEQLREAANKALSEQRLYAPAGDNAMEYYVALRDKSPTDAAVVSALTDLMPYALIAAEQSIARDDLSEAQRLHALMEKVDPQAPALPRLKQGIADAQTTLAQRTAAAEAQTQTQEEARRQAELERERLAEQQRAQQQAAQQIAAQQAAAEQRATEQRAAEQRAAEQRAAEQRQAQQAAAPATPPPAASAPAPASTALRAISTPAPVYPPSALRLETSGEVLVEFTVDTDGTVTNARVVRATPPRVFDRAAISAVNKWRFQPVASSVTTRRTIAFNPGG